VSLLDTSALERGCRDAGLLPTDLARQLHRSVDIAAAFIGREVPDHHVTLADLRGMAEAVGLGPHDLLLSPGTHEEPHPHSAQLAALLQRNGTATILELAEQLGCTDDELLDAVDAFNHVACGLKIIRWGGEVGLVPDPALKLPSRPPRNTPKQADTDRLLWQVIDRALPTPIPKHVSNRLQGMRREGLVVVLDDEWRPSDAVICALDLIAWDTLELVTQARATAASSRPPRPPPVS